MGSECASLSGILFLSPHFIESEQALWIGYAFDIYCFDSCNYMLLATQYIAQLCILLDSHVRNRVLMERTSTLLGGGVNAEKWTMFIYVTSGFWSWVEFPPILNGIGFRHLTSGSLKLAVTLPWLAVALQVSVLEGSWEPTWEHLTDRVFYS